jgi:hypothetical protein
MRIILIAIVAALVLEPTPAEARGRAGGKGPGWSSVHRTQYRALKQQVRGEYRALKRVRRQRALTSAERRRLSALRDARDSFSDATAKRMLGHGVVAITGTMMAQELASFFGGHSGGGRLGLVTACSLGLNVGPGYSMYLDSRRTRARGIAQARRAGVPVPAALATSARRTLLLEARAHRDLAGVMSEPSLAGAARATELANSLR